MRIDLLYAVNSEQNETNSIFPLKKLQEEIDCKNTQFLTCLGQGQGKQN